MSAKSKNISPQEKQPAKEVVIRQLVETIESKGVEVRREKLKAGPGWKVTSGACRFEEKKLVFLDSKLTQDEQIEFLKYKAAQL